MRSTNQHIYDAPLPRQPQYWWGDIRYKLSLLDKVSMMLVLMLIIIGLISVYSATMFLIEGNMSAPSPESYLMKQAVSVVAGIMLLVFFVVIPYRWYTKEVLIQHVNVIILMALVFTLTKGIIAGGAQSWINIGPFNLQPSEFAKIGNIFLFAFFIMNTDKEPIRSKNIGDLMSNRLSIIVILLSTGLIVAQPDWGMAMIIIASLTFMWVVNKYAKKGFTIFVVVILALFVLAQVLSRTFGDVLIERGGFRLARIASFAIPFKYAQSAGYQLVQAYVALSHGGLFGVGIGGGQVKISGVPAGHTDYILALMGEEIGYVGIVCVIGLLFLLVIRFFYLAAKMSDLFRKCIVSGIAGVLLIQIIINIGGVTGILPLTGVTLPFISYGGSSMMLSIAAIGIIQAFIIQEKREQVDL